MVKRVNANLPDEIHKVLRVKLAEDEANFSDWLRERVEEYIDKRKKVAPKHKKGGATK